MSVMDTGQEAASIPGFNEKTVRLYRKEFFEQKGNFRQGKYKRHCLLNEENLKLDAAMWIRENAYMKGESKYDSQVVLPVDQRPAASLT